jgi:hypothetical protein
MAMKERVLRLRPTQLAIGMREVQAKVEKLAELDARRLHRYVKKHAIRVVRSPQDELYVTDHHHLLAALWLVGVKKVRVSVERNFSKRKLSRPQFWQLLVRRGLVHLFDQFGNGPHEPFYLPQDIRGLGDDPYRSLAWLARQNHGFAESKEPYYEFQWAQLLRRAKLLDPGGAFQIDEVLDHAVKVCRSAEARGLPGYIGPRRRNRSRRPRFAVA